MMHFLIPVAVWTLNLAYSESVDLPILKTPCPRNSDNYTECSKRIVQESLPYLVAGIPEFNIPPLDPLVAQNVNSSIEFGPVRVKFSFSNMTLQGLSKAEFLSVNPKVEGKHLHIDLKIYQRHLLVDADHEVTGTVVEYEMNGKGHMNISMTDVTMVIVMDGPIVNDKWIIETVDVTHRIGDMKWWASDLFDGNTVLTEGVLAFINEHWRYLYESGVPTEQNFINTWFKDLLKKILADFPITQAFP